MTPKSEMETRRPGAATAEDEVQQQAGVEAVSQSEYVTCDLYLRMVLDREQEEAERSYGEWADAARRYW